MAKKEKENKEIPQAFNRQGKRIER